MTKRHYTALLTIACAVVVVASGLWASNMGFKLNYPMLGTGSSPAGNNTIALPYNRQAGIDNAEELVTDIGGFANASGPVTNIQRLVTESQTFQVYTGAPGEPVFDLNAGEGYFIKLAAADVDYIVVGSHAPGMTVTLLGSDDAGCTGACIGQSLYGYPYHSTASSAEELANELGGFTNAAGPVKNLQRLVPSSGNFQVYTGAPGEPVFDLVPGEAYVITLKFDVPYVPSHF